MNRIYIFFIFVMLTITTTHSQAETNATNGKFKVLVLTERGGQHGGFTDAAIAWLDDFSKVNNFEITEIRNTDKIDEAFLSNFKVMIQLDFPPYRWSDVSKRAFEKYIQEGLGGWIGFHHATLLGEFDGYPMWEWFSRFMGTIRFQNYIAATASGTVRVEQSTHPVMKGVSPSFVVTHDEWYTFNRNPRPNVQVLANVDESSYNPDSNIKMGDHPAIWTNPSVKARNVYFLMGHDADLLRNSNFTTLFSNAILWAAKIQTSEISQREIQETGTIHRPLPIDYSRSLEEAGLKKEVLLSSPLCSLNELSGWSHRGIGSIQQANRDDKGYLRLLMPTEVADWKNADHVTYGSSQAVFDTEGTNWEKYNRILFRIYPDCEGSRNVHLNLYLTNDGVLKVPDEYGREGSHEINLINRQWNTCYLEITEMPRDKVTQLIFGATAFGRDRTTGKEWKFDIGDIELQQIEAPEIVSGWIPGKGRIVYSTSGYHSFRSKTAVLNLSDKAVKQFQILDSSGKTVYEGEIETRKTGLGVLSIIDFSPFTQMGEYQIQVGNIHTPFFPISDKVWESSIWKTLNFIFCERCGYPVPEKHDYCHADLLATHNGRTLAYNGGWHDAGDMSQQSLQTGDVMFALFEMANKVKGKDESLYYRLLEEAEWGLDFILKCRFGDGYRASSAGIAIWTDNMTGNEDDTPARVHNNPFDNFLLAGMEAYAALSIEKDAMRKESLIRTAKEDFNFALEEHGKNGYGNFRIFWEHSYNTSESQYMATASWAASQLYRLTGETFYAEQAADFMEYTLACQRTEPLGDKDQIRGFFYRDKAKKVITHFNHQSREQVYMQALVTLCETQPQHPSCPEWKRAVTLYADYLKKITRYVQPYNIIPSGVYHIDEAKDSASFYAQHLMPGENATEDYVKQLKKGIQLDKEHYLKIFPVWFSFRGNTAIHLAMGKAAAICGNFLNDPELLEMAEEQLRWTVGKNPFGQSLIYGEGYNYAQQYVALPGEMVGEIPVGIQTKYNEDQPYWPQSNNATYKEVWVTSAGKWLSLLSELQ